MSVCGLCRQGNHDSWWNWGGSVLQKKQNIFVLIYVCIYTQQKIKCTRNGLQWILSTRTLTRCLVESQGQSSKSSTSCSECGTQYQQPDSNFCSQCGSKRVGMSSSSFSIQSCVSLKSGQVFRLLIRVIIKFNLIWSFVGSWSPMKFRWLFWIEHQCSLSICCAFS